MPINVIMRITGTFFELIKYIYNPCTGIAYEKNDFAIYFNTNLPKVIGISALC
jgi:hypothetical protein